MSAGPGFCRGLWRSAWLLAALLLAQVHGVQAHTCTAASPGTQSFGNVSPVSGASYSTSGSIAVTCTVAPLEGLATGTIIRACLSIGGSAGSTPRTLPSGGYSVQYNLYADSAHTQVFGSVTSSPAAAVPVDFNLGLLGILLGGTATINVPLYGYLPANQTTTPAGSYTASFSGSGAALNFTSYVGSPPSCSGAWTSGGSFPFSVAATVINDCNISANNLSFGSSGVLASALFATGAVTAQCTLNDNYAIALNAGTSTGATVANRLMTLSGGSATVQYQLYTASACATIWGDGTAGTSTLGGSGSGANQTYVVYGEVAAQTTPGAGAYSDTVTATITY